MTVQQGYVEDWNYIGIDDVVNITPPGKHYSLPYVCVLRHGHNTREFELLRSPLEEDTDSHLLVLEKKSSGIIPHFAKTGFRVVDTNIKNFPGWHFNKYGSNKVIPELN